MSKRLAVLLALKALLAAELPDVEVLGLTGDDAEPSTIPSGGRMVIMSGDPGDPEVDLSPLTYNYNHAIPIAIVSTASTDSDAETIADGIMVRIGITIEANRTLDGLCDWLEPTAPTTEYDLVEGADPPKNADLIIVASYATTNPLI